MASIGCIKRLQTELKNFKLNPSPGCDAAPSDTDILTWYYIIDGARDSPYEGGEYIGKISFPNDYPFKAPSIMVITPNGRFEPNKNICMSMTAFHPESWQPSWQTATIIVGLQSFMAEEGNAIAAITKSTPERKKLAAESHKWNLANVPQFPILFPARYARAQKIVKGEKVEPLMSAATASGNSADGSSASAALIDYSQMKNEVVKEACKKANEAILQAEEKSKAMKAAAAANSANPAVVVTAAPPVVVTPTTALPASAGDRRGRDEGTSATTTTTTTTSQKVPANSANAKNKAEVIELE
jgi:ubiquitin-conjugating enzyme E2 J2